MFRKCKRAISILQHCRATPFTLTAISASTIWVPDSMIIIQKEQRLLRNGERHHFGDWDSQKIHKVGIIFSCTMEEQRVLKKRSSCMVEKNCKAKTNFNN